jgi:hypothetical protein
MDPLDAAEQLDHYRAACAASAANRQARAGQTYALDSIGTARTNFLRDAAGKFPLTASAEFAILNSSADGGLPHTRPPNLICLPASGIPNSSTPEFSETLLHEGVHIHQRLHPTLWIKAVQRAGWREATAAQIPPEIVARVRINPDTMAAPYWSWDNHIPLPLFPKGVPEPSLSSATTQWLDVRTGVLHPAAPPSFREKGNRENGSAAEHPFELYAYRFSRQGLKSHEEIVRALGAL